MDVRLLDAESRIQAATNTHYWLGFLYEPDFFENYEFASNYCKTVNDIETQLYEPNILKNPQKCYNNILYHLCFTIHPEKISRKTFSTLIQLSTGEKTLGPFHLVPFINNYYCFIQRFNDWKSFLSNEELYKQHEKKYLEYTSQPNGKSLLRIMEWFDSLSKNVRLRVIVWSHNFFDNIGNLRAEILESSKMAEQALDTMKQVESRLSKLGPKRPSISKFEWSYTDSTKQSILGFYPVPGNPIRTFHSFMYPGQAISRHHQSGKLNLPFSHEKMDFRKTHKLCYKCGIHSDADFGCMIHPLMEFYNICAIPEYMFN